MRRVVLDREVSQKDGIMAPETQEVLLCDKNKNRLCHRISVYGAQGSCSTVPKPEEESNHKCHFNKYST